MFIMLKCCLKQYLSMKCIINYYTKENNPSNIGEFINCYKYLEGINNL